MSPRDFDSDEVARSPEQLQLRFTENVECRICGLLFEGVFYDPDNSMTVEDIVEPPIGEHQCPGCGHRWISAYSGWSFYTEAG